MLEKRFISVDDLELRYEADSPTKISGYAAKFQSFSKDLGGFFEIIRPGAFTRSLTTQKDVIANLEHDNAMILARTKAGNLRLSEDSIGLRFELDIPNTTVGRDTAENIKNGNLQGASFAFKVVKDNFRKEPDKIVRELLDVDLFDVAVVSTPAYQASEVALRSFEEFKAQETLTAETTLEEDKSETPVFVPDMWLDLQQQQIELES